MSELRRCEVKYCLRDAAWGRKKCETCRSRIRREKYPTRQAFTQLKINAGRRGIKFALTYVYWLEFCRVNRYIELRGTGKFDMTIDRIKAYKGYVDGNLQMLTNTMNAKKQVHDKKESAKQYRSTKVPDDVF